MITEDRSTIERRTTDRHGTTVSADGTNRCQDLARFVNGGRDRRAIATFRHHVKRETAYLARLEADAEMCRSPRDRAKARLEWSHRSAALVDTLSMIERNAPRQRP